MEIDVKRIARLAKLHIPEDEAAELAAQMTAMVAMVEHLPEIESANALLDCEDTMALREDVVLPSYPREAILQNAPQAADGCFVVPKTVE